MKLIFKTLVVFVMMAFIVIKLTMFYSVELAPHYLALIVVVLGAGWLTIILSTNSTDI